MYNKEHDKHEILDMPVTIEAWQAKINRDSSQIFFGIWKSHFLGRYIGVLK